MKPDLIINSIHEFSLRNPKAEAILAPERSALNYASLYKQVCEIALALNHIQINQDSRIAVVLPNGPETAVCFLAVSSVCVCAPLNPAYTADEYKFYLADLKPNAIILLANSQTPARSVAEKLGIQIIDLSLDPSDSAGVFKLSTNQPSNYLDAPIFGDLDKTALILHTSGTTSRPKIVPLTRRNIFYSMQNIAQTYDLSSGDRVLNIMPLFHIHGLIGALSSTLFSGGSVICAPGLNMDKILDWLIEYQPTWYTAVPTMHQAIVEQARQHPEKSSNIKLRFIRSSSSALSPAVAIDLEKTFNTPVLEAYGMTEAAHQMSSNPLLPRLHKFGSVGMQTGTTQIVVLDEDGNQLSANIVGEICIRGENVMSGYENNPEANASAFINGWLRTGDLGYLDQDGYLFIHGRSKEMINRGGEKISPREIDDVVLQHPSVKQAVAFAVPHSTLGEDIAVAVVLREACQLSVHDLRMFVADKLSEFKVPRQIVFLDEIPKGPTGKIQRIGLAEKLSAQLQKTSSYLNDNSMPSNQFEADLLMIWQEILGNTSIGVHDDFISVGGDSLRAAQVLAKVNKLYSIKLTMRDLFDTSSITDLAGLLKKIDEK